MRLKFDNTTLLSRERGLFFGAKRPGPMTGAGATFRRSPNPLKYTLIHSITMASISPHQWSMTMNCLAPFHSAQDDTSSERAPSAATLLLDTPAFLESPTAGRCGRQPRLCRMFFARAFYLLRLTRILTPRILAPTMLGIYDAGWSARLMPVHR
jgi:hypothetical protein